MEPRAWAAAALLGAAALGGCLGAPSGSGDAPSAPGEPAAPSALAFEACREFHAFFATPWATWAPRMPPGFGPDGTDPTGTLTTFYRHVSLCRLGAAEVAVAWAGLRVAPPPDLALPDAVLHAVATEVLASGAELAAAYRAWGFGDAAREGTVEVAGTRLPGGSDTGTIVLRAEGATTTLVYHTGMAAEGSVAGAGRAFAVRGGQVAGWFDYAWPGWREVGMGPVASLGGAGPGDGDAGNIHQVDDVALTVAGAGRT